MGVCITGLMSHARGKQMRLAVVLLFGKDVCGTICPQLGGADQCTGLRAPLAGGGLSPASLAFHCPSILW